uniref:Uncharacterized protein n=1 Tax=Staphylococcus phage UHP46 TaxID=3234966 RepID=A0AB39C849_9CAUD
METFYSIIVVYTIIFFTYTISKTYHNIVSLSNHKKIDSSLTELKKDIENLLK